MPNQLSGGFEELLTMIQGIDKDAVIVGISGFSGSGKSTLTSKLQKSLKNSAHVPTDAFMVDNLNRRSDDWDTIDRDRIIKQVIEPMRADKDIRYQVYDWDKNEAKLWCELPHPKYLLLEGTCAIHPDLLPYLDWTVWIDRAQADAAASGMRRDHEERGYNHDDLWHNIVIPNDRDYFDRHHPRKNANFIYKETTK